MKGTTNMQNSIADTIQPLLIDTLHFNRFMGRYYLSAVKEGKTKDKQKCLKLSLSDASADIDVYCCAPELLQDTIEPYRWINVEASQCRNAEIPYFRCKNLVVAPRIPLIGLDLSTLPRSLCREKKAFDALFLIFSYLTNAALKEFTRDVLLMPEIGVRFIGSPNLTEKNERYQKSVFEQSIAKALSAIQLNSFTKTEKDLVVVASLFSNLNKLSTATDSGCEKFKSGFSTNIEVICEEPFNKLTKVAPNLAQKLKKLWTEEPSKKQDFATNEAIHYSPKQKLVGIKSAARAPNY